MSDEHDREYLEHLKFGYGTDDEELIDKLEDAQEVPLCEMYLERLSWAIANGLNVTKQQIADGLSAFPDEVEVSLSPALRKRLCMILQGKNKGGQPSDLSPAIIFGHPICRRYFELKAEVGKGYLAKTMTAEEFGVSESWVGQLLKQYKMWHKEGTE